MNTITRIAKNTAVLIISQIIGYILSFFYTIYLARYLGPTNFGVLTFAIAVTAIFSIVTDFGLSSLMVREIARNKSILRKYVKNIVLIKIIVVLISYGLMALIVNIIGFPRDTIIVVYFLGLSILFQTFAQMIYAVFQALEKMEYQAIVTILNSILLFTGILIGINLNFSVTNFALIYVVANCLCLLISIAFYITKTPDRAVSTGDGARNKLIGLDFSF
jgi:O-antigen/teichoic acid export membrane protein